MNKQHTANLFSSAKKYLPCALMHPHGISVDQDSKFCRRRQYFAGNIFVLAGNFFAVHVEQNARQRVAKFSRHYKYISREILATAAKFGILVNMFAVIFYGGSRQRNLCRAVCLCRASIVHFAMTLSLPCAVVIICRASFVCRAPCEVCTAKNCVPCSEVFRRTAERPPHGKTRFSGSVGS